MTELLNEEVSNTKTCKYFENAYEIMVPEKVESLHFDFHIEKSIWLTCMVYDEQKNLRGQLLKAGESGEIFIHEQTDKSSPYTVSSTIHSGQWIVDLVIIAYNTNQVNDNCCDIIVCYIQY